jgi:Tfp pilus assembly protein PilE
MQPDSQLPPEPQNQTPPQPTFAPSHPQSQVQPTGEDPGKGLAIAGLILAFFFSLVGLILSILAKKKSSAAGFHNSLATVAIVLNSVFLALGLLLIPILVLISMASYGAIQERAKTSSATSSAYSLLKYTEAFYAENGFYPTSMSEMNATDTTKIADKEEFEVSLSPITKATATKAAGEKTQDVLNLYGCKQKGNIIVYWDHQTNSEASVSTLGAFDEADCTIVVD